MHLQSGQGHFDQCRYTVMVSHTGELQAVVFGAAFKSEDHPLPEEGKHMNVNLIPVWSILIYLLLLLFYPQMK